MVVIDHGNINGVKITNEYGHLSSLSIKTRQKVKKEKTATSNRNLIDDANLVIELSKDAYSLFLSQTPKEKAELMKLLTIELLFDGEKLIITPHSAFSALLNLRKCHKLERADT